MVELAGWASWAGRAAWTGLAGWAGSPAGLAELAGWPGRQITSYLEALLARSANFFSEITEKSRQLKYRKTQYIWRIKETNYGENKFGYPAS